MKQGIHPEYVPTTVTCTCGNTFETRSTITSGTMRVDVCSASKPVMASASAKSKLCFRGGRRARRPPLFIFHCTNGAVFSLFAV